MNKMSEIKFTSDGKKVVVVGKLNAQETIVQEIFVNGDAEFPSGENFVVKSLHDIPAESWKEKELRQLNERYERERAKWNRQIDEIEKQFRTQQNILKEKLKNTNGWIKQIDEPIGTLLQDFMKGEIKYIVWTGYDPEILDFDEKLISTDRYSDVSFKLISLCGRSDGNLEWRINSCYDGSGSSNVFFPAKTKEDAIEALRVHICNLTSYNESIIKVAGKYQITLNPDVYAKYKEQRVAGIKSNIERYEKDLEKSKKDLESIEFDIENQQNL